MYLGNAPGDLAGDKGVSPPRRLVVEEDPVGCVHAVRLPVVDNYPVGVHFGASVRRSGVERGQFALRHFLNLRCFNEFY